MPKFLRLSSIAGEPLLADIGHLGGELAPRFVTLAVDYLMENPGAGFPVRPCFVGDVTQVALGIGVVEVDGRRQGAAFHGDYTGQGLGRGRRGEQMAGHALG